MCDKSKCWRCGVGEDESHLWGFKHDDEVTYVCTPCWDARSKELRDKRKQGKEESHV